LKSPKNYQVSKIINIEVNLMTRKSSKIKTLKLWKSQVIKIKNS